MQMKPGPVALGRAEMRKRWWTPVFPEVLPDHAPVNGMPYTPEHLNIYSQYRTLSRETNVSVYNKFIPYPKTN